MLTPKKPTGDPASPAAYPEASARQSAAVRSSTSAATLATPPATRANWPVRLWATIGVGALALQTIVWMRFIASGPRSLTYYRDIESSAYVAAKLFEVTLIVLTVGTVGLTIRGVLIARQWTTNAMLLVAFASMLWIDPMLNYLRPGFYFSQNLTNIESWVQFIPGQLAPHANHTPVPYIWIIGAYVGFFLPVLLANVKLLTLIRRRWNVTSPVALVIAALPLSVLLDFILETVAIRTGVMAYPAASHRWSLWGGTIHQFPLIQIFAASMFWAVFSVIIFLVDTRGWTPAERGAESFQSSRVRTAVRQLALIGLANTLFLTLPLGIVQLTVAYTDDFPDGFPTHLSGQWCGTDDQPYGPCPGPGVPWQVRVPGTVDQSPTE